MIDWSSITPTHLFVLLALLLVSLVIAAFVDSIFNPGARHGNLKAGVVLFLLVILFALLWLFTPIQRYLP